MRSSVPQIATPACPTLTGRWVMTLLFLLWAVLLPLSSQAQCVGSPDVDPELVAGNPSLGEDCFRIEPVESGTYTSPAGFEVTITVYDGKFFSFTSEYPIDYVVVKGGPNANIYDYSPEGTCADECLSAPADCGGGDVQCGLSHIDFCYSPPTIECPDDVTVECDESTDPADTGFPTITPEPCEGTADVEYEDEITEGSCPNEYTIERTFTYTAFGITVSCTQTITVEDNTDPEITCPADVTVECGESTDPADTGEATGTDNCGDVDITYEDSFVPDCGETGVITRTWTAEDECGNTATCTQLITIEDTTPPDITCPADVTVECGASTDVADTGEATGEDSCGDVDIKYEDSFAPDCGETGVITRTWTATDECGNTASCDQLITIEDTTPPSITCPPDVSVDCGESTDPAATGEATGEDTCGDVEITYEDNAEGGCEGGIVRTWTATDECGNTATCEQIIRIIDETDPTITCPPDATVECGASTDPAATGEATGEDDCSDVEITYEDSFAPACGATGVINRVWTATDACGNTASCTQLITIVDETPPSITCPPDVTVECGESTDPADTGEASGEDACGDVEITYEDSFEPGCGETGVITRTWTATDECGNTASCDQIITIEDTTAPTCEIVGDPPVIDCGDELPDLRYLVSTEDVCGEVTIEQFPAPGTIVTGPIDVIFTVTDECGNSAECEILTLDCIPPPPAGCTYTPGYWKNHPEDICVETITLDCGLEIDVLDALNAHGSNPWDILVRAYAAAYLNNFCGTGSWDCIAGDIEDAEELLCLGRTYAGKLKGSARNVWTRLASRIDAFNNGFGGTGCPVHCTEPLSVQSRSSMTMEQPASAPQLNAAADIDATVYPNPAEGYMIIGYRVAKDSRVSVVIYNLLGAEVTTLFTGDVTAGVQQMVTLHRGQLAAGIYVYRIVTEDGAYEGKFQLTD